MDDLIERLEPLAILFVTDDLHRPSTRLRHVVMYLMNTELRVSFARIADLFELDRTTVRHAIGRVEDLRDDKRFDTAVDAVAAALAISREFQAAQKA